ncbi:fungal-specific transcription factor domain-containing protein [Mrakia frigida]|uniref:fungal specific transcription factor domain-containing protein n=1 Tax=Mrakia frigida TaxID=29902 RepID=UPI003FCBF84A
MANFDFDQSTALPWDLQRHLEALLAGQAQGQGGADSYRDTSGGSQDELFPNFLFDEPGGGGGGGRIRAEVEGDEGGDGDRTPFARSSLQVPFFRWFGPTAYTPGLRRVKVELRASEPSQDGPSNNITSPSSNLQRTLSSSSSSASASASHPMYENPQQQQQYHQPPYGSNHAGGGRPSSEDRRSSSQAGDSPGRTAEESRRTSHRDALFKTGRHKAFPVDELFEELLDVFWINLSSHYPFLSKRRILEQHRSRTLPALLANCICALASRFSNHPLLVPLRSHPSRLYESAIPFEEQAKYLLVPLLSFPTEETCTALVLLSWNEFGGGRDSGHFMFTGMAIRVVQDLGMQHEISLAPRGEGGPNNESQREEIARRRLLFWSVFLMDRFISWGVGRKATIAENEIDVALPTIEDCDLLNPPAEGAPRAPHPWPALIYITRHRGLISDSLNAPGGNTDLKSRVRVERLQSNMIAFYSSMDPVLHFSVQSFKLYRDQNLSPCFLLLHLLFHSVITVLHRPSLLQNFSHGGQVLVEPNVEVSRSSARTLANMLSYADLAGPVAILANPFADQLIFISAMAFLDERVTLELSRKVDSMGLGMSSSSSNGGSAQSSVFDGTKTPTGTRLLRSFADSKLDVSVSALKQITALWAGVGWVIRTIEQKKRGYAFEDFDPDYDAEEPSVVLFPRDPAMIKSWLAREWTSRTDGKVDTPNWSSGAPWDEKSLEMAPADIGLSFTGQSGDSSHLTMSIDAPGGSGSGGGSDPSAGFYMPSQAGGGGGASSNPFDLPYPMDNLPPSFFSDVVWGGGGH